MCVCIYMFYNVIYIYVLKCVFFKTPKDCDLQRMAIF